MCYSAQIKSDYSKYVRLTGARIDVREFFDLFWRRTTETKIKVPKALEAWFEDPQTDQEREVKGAIDQFVAAEVTRVEQELFKQRKRLADAERTLQSKSTKAALESQRIATSKVEWCLARLSSLHRTEPKDRDDRFFPGWYAPVMVIEDGQRVIKPMRYQCRPDGKPAFFDSKFPGTYNARRDNLHGSFWKPVFGRTHGVLVVRRFYENVNREGKNVVLEFDPNTGEDMLVACLWSRWSAPGEPDLLSFAAVTDDPPPEVAAAGHDRCIVPLKAEHVEAWLNPNPSDLDSLYAILDDRQRPYYEHRLAA